MKKYKTFYISALFITVVLFGLYLTAFYTGAGAIKFMGARIDIHNNGSYQLYKINDTLAVYIDKTGTIIEIMSYGKTSRLYTIAGEYDLNGGDIFMVSADYQKGDYIYTAYTDGPTTIVNIKTGETVGRLTENNGEPVDPGTLEDYRKRGLVFDEKYRLTKEMVISQFEKLNTFNDNLFKILIAFLFVFGVFILAGLAMVISVLRRKKKIEYSIKDGFN